ncbi:PilZ domain-containing protein [Marispirochaeta aestuarii]|uniref:PilZ domain-containing protein n=1 Tax=Marispirochaeta aestuarii TaxID=1963862 RepID=UPI0029C9458C|nr:PilZ domain-containing protein [Marispirochaeta aestuarii]
MDKRRFSRTGFQTSGEILLGDRRIEVSVIDLSLKGALFSSDADISVDSPVELLIHLSNSELSINAEGKIVHREGSKYGIRFSSIDAESMIHLRSLMEYNTENYDKIGSELAFLFHEEDAEEN